MGIYNFGEVILNQINERKRAEQQQREFNQKMSFENRQLSLLGDFKQQAAINDRATTISNIQDKYVSADSIEGRQNPRTKNVETPSGYSVPFVPFGDLNKQFGLDVFGSGNYVDKDLVPQTSDISGKDRYEEMGTYDVEGKPKKRFRDKFTGEEFYSEDDVYYQPYKGTNVNINYPKPEKWKEFGKYVTEAQTTDYFNSDDNKIEKLKPEEVANRRNRLRNEWKSQLLPGAKSWYDKNFEGNEDVSNQYFLSKVRYGLSKDEITAEEAQDLIDASAYRNEVFNNYKSTPKEKTNFLGF